MSAGHSHALSIAMLATGLPEQSVRAGILTPFSMNFFQPSFPIGKFLVSPSSRITETGNFAAAVSIRSGQGSGTHDRVFHFLPRFASQENALRYAASQGRRMIRLQQMA